MGFPPARPVGDEKQFDTMFSRQLHKFYCARNCGGSIVRIPVIEHAVLEWRREKFLKSHVADQGLIDIKNDRGRQFSITFLPGHRGPGLIGDQARKIVTCSSINLHRNRIELRGIPHPDNSRMWPGIGIRSWGTREQQGSRLRY
jgi:hypothetical protein